MVDIIITEINHPIRTPPIFQENLKVNLVHLEPII